MALTIEKRINELTNIINDMILEPNYDEIEMINYQNELYYLIKKYKCSTKIHDQPESFSKQCTTRKELFI